MSMDVITATKSPRDEVVHITRGYSRDHRPDLNQVMVELMVEPQAGMPILLQPLSGNSRDAQDFGEAVRTPMKPLHTTYGMTYWVADGALYSAANLQKLAQTPMQGARGCRQPWAQPQRCWPKSTRRR